jgi:predicted outer membrane repeat protein
MNYINFTNSAVFKNIAQLSGGGIAATSRSTIVLKDSKLSYHQAESLGGGIFLAFTSNGSGGALALDNTFWWTFGSSTA